MPRSSDDPTGWQHVQSGSGHRGVTFFFRLRRGDGGAVGSTGCAAIGFVGGSTVDAPAPSITRSLAARSSRAPSPASSAAVKVMYVDVELVGSMARQMLWVARWAEEGSRSRIHSCADNGEAALTSRPSAATTRAGVGRRAHVGATRSSIQPGECGTPL